MTLLENDLGHISYIMHTQFKFMTAVLWYQAKIAIKSPFEDMEVKKPIFSSAIFDSNNN